jgi:hypothetical protein
VLRYFRINDPYRLISLLVLMILASLPLLIDFPEVTAQELKDLVIGERVGNKIMYVDLIDRTPPLMAVLDGFLNFLFGRSVLARHIAALVILFFQAAYFGILLINNRAYNENTYVPSLIFGFLCLFSFDLLSLTPELLASTLLLLALNNIFKEIEFRVDRDSVVLNLGIFLGLASLIVFSYTIFLFGAMVMLIIFARTSARKVLLMLLGYGLVHGIVFTLYYYYGHSADLWRNFYLASVGQAGVSVGLRTMLVLIAVPGFYFIISLFMLTRDARFTRYQSQIFQVLFLWLIFASIELLLEPAIAPHTLMTFLPPIAYFISHYLLLIHRRRIAEYMLVLFLAGVLIVNLAAYNGKIKEVDYSGFFAKPSQYASQIKGKRVMVVGDDIGLYRWNSLGGSFLDWELSKDYFGNPDVYENIIKRNDAFAEDPPEAIVDELNMIAPLFERLPRVRKMYRKEGSVYWRI